MRRIAERIRQALPIGLTADELAAALLAALPGEGADDAPAAAALAARLRGAPGELTPVISELLALRSSAERQAPAMLGRLLGARQDDRIYVSLGSHCFGASLLRRWGLRDWAGPFDWLFSCAGMVTHCLEDDFASLLDRRLYEPVPVEQRRDGPTFNRVHHRMYREMFGIEHVFNHHDAHLDSGHAYFFRCVDRLRAALRSDATKLFLLTRTKDTGTPGDVEALRDALARRTERFELVVVEVPWDSPSGAPVPSLVTVREGPRFVTATLEPVSHWGPLAFDEIVDEHLLMRFIVARADGPPATPRTGSG